MNYPPYQINCKQFRSAPIDGVIVTPLEQFDDERGWLLELFRADEVGESQRPAMGYISQTKPTITRGPHLHFEQTDHFVALGPGTVEFCIWDDRIDQSTYGNQMIIVAGTESPKRITIPPMVVHAYRNIGTLPCRLLNFPNRLYAGAERKSPVDEVRFEEFADHPFHW